MRRSNVFKELDWLTIALYLILAVIGWFTIYSAAFSEENPSIFDFTQSYGKQFIWLVISCIIGIGIVVVDSKFYHSFSYLIYGISVLLLIMVLFMGRKVSGSMSWFEIGPIRIQPSEFAKFGAALALARFLSSYNSNIVKSLKDRLLVLIIIFLPSVLIIIQGDTGSALVFTALILVLYREGWPAYQLVFVILIAITGVIALLIDKFILIGIILLLGAAIIYFIRKKKQMIIVTVAGLVILCSFVYTVDYSFNNILKPYQKERINVLLGKKVDPRGAAYNVNQSKIAIGSGGFIGKGFMKGTQTKFNFVPEQSTDFIFCTIGEEQGFVGSLLVLGLFTALLIRIVFLAERQKQNFSRMYAYGVASIIFIHIVINIGMTIGLAPVIGIPFPLISYGGSSLFGFTILLFILLKLDADRKEVLG